MKLKLTLLLMLMSILLLAAADTAAQGSQGNAAIDAFMQERMESLDIPGAALAVVRDGEMVHLAGYGVGNEAGDPVTPQTPFLLASLSKPVTAVAVMQLVEAGQIELDAPIQQYLPWLLPDTPITVRQLLHQTSGLDETQGYRRNLEPDAPDALAASIRWLADTELNNPPGTAFEYSNSNYDILGLLIETVTGQPYGDYIQANIFNPLEMSRSFTSLEGARTAGMSSAFYPFFGRQTNFDNWLPYTRAVQPSAGLVGSAEDMAHFVLAQLQNGRYQTTPLLSPVSMAALHTPDPATGPDVQYAMGWAVWPFDDAALPGDAAPTALSHGGEWLGFSHILLFIPAYDVGVVLLMNGPGPTNGSAFSNVAFDVALLALGLEAQHYPPQEDWLTQNLRPLAAILILLLLASGAIAIRRLRGAALTRRDSWFFVALALVDLVLVGYLLFIRLPAAKSNVPLTLRFEPDLGLMLLVILLLTLGWGLLRSLWVVWRWRASN
ncbi:MAG: beta-lactamase family protein [Anaerolineae bacterium]|nr:beta-lactamase family protein [Anaerolineae bacterium]